MMTDVMTDYLTTDSTNLDSGITKRDLISELVSPTQFNLLVVEDNTVNQLVIQKILVKLGYNVDVASNGQEALSMLEKSSDDRL